MAIEDAFKFVKWVMEYKTLLSHFMYNLDLSLSNVDDNSLYITRRVLSLVATYGFYPSLFDDTLVGSAQVWYFPWNTELFGSEGLNHASLPLIKMAHIFVIDMDELFLRKWAGDCNSPVPAREDSEDDLYTDEIFLDSDEDEISRDDDVSPFDYVTFDKIGISVDIPEHEVFWANYPLLIHETPSIDPAPEDRINQYMRGYERGREMIFSQFTTKGKCKCVSQDCDITSHIHMKEMLTSTDELVHARRDYTRRDASAIALMFLLGLTNKHLKLYPNTKCVVVHRIIRSWYDPMFDGRPYLSLIVSQITSSRMSVVEATVYRKGVRSRGFFSKSNQFEASSVVYERYRFDFAVHRLVGIPLSSLALCMPRPFPDVRGIAWMTLSRHFVFVHPSVYEMLSSLKDGGVKFYIHNDVGVNQVQKLFSPPYLGFKIPICDYNTKRKGGKMLLSCEGGPTLSRQMPDIVSWYRDLIFIFSLIAR